MVRYSSMIRDQVSIAIPNRGEEVGSFESRYLLTRQLEGGVRR